MEEKRCSMCGCMETEENTYTIILKKGDKEVGTYNGCAQCMKSRFGLIETEVCQDTFEDDFEDTFGNPYLGSDFL